MEAATTPMLKQYQTLKNRYKDSILFFRLGDFYEMFYDDALVSSPLLNVVLTSRDAGKSGRIPMCGIPYHARQNYISKLIKAGHKVAICEQVEDPALAKGLVKREVTRLITAGTFIDETSDESRCLAALCFKDEACGLAILDMTQGLLQANQYTGEAKLLEALAKLSVYECVYPLADEEKVRTLFKHPLLLAKTVALSACEDWCFNTDIARKNLQEHFKTHSLRGFGIEDLPLAAAGSGALLEYVKQANRMPMRHITRLCLYTDSDQVFISPAAFYGLGMQELLRCIDRTVTSLGRRCLKEWLYHPLKDRSAILQRQSAIGLLRDSPDLLEALRLQLRTIPDIEKSILRISSADSQAKDLLALRTTLLKVPDLQKTAASLLPQNSLFALTDNAALRELLEKALDPQMPLSNPQGRIIRSGYHSSLDEIRSLQENARSLLKELQARQIKRTGISSLKIGYNQVFGYYIEVTKANLPAVPADYTRKQTLVNCERFITPELKEYEEKMLSAQGRLLELEQTLIKELERQILDASDGIHTLALQIATIDTLCSLAARSLSDGYCAPKIEEDTTLHIEEGRHPVVEESLSGAFIPNDTLLDTADNHLIVLTGPNMSGKSTYIRQAAVLVILAQMGSFIPARRASIGIIDKIFTRIGAHDEITKGQSTFMVEMSETAEIVNNLTPRSLIILDEIGRGTSTYDGLSLAWALAEHLHEKRTRTLFATHFHELTALAADLQGVKNFNVAVKEWNDEVIFLHKIVPGGTDDSYGIYVAKLAGIPAEVIRRAQEILTRLELSGKLHDKIRKSGRTADEQLSFMLDKDDQAVQRIKEELLKLNLDTITPLEVMGKVQEWKKGLE